MEIHGAKTFKITQLSNNKIEIIIECENKLATTELYDTIKLHADKGIFDMKFGVKRKK